MGGTLCSKYIPLKAVCYLNSDCKTGFTWSCSEAEKAGREGLGEGGRERRQAVGTVTTQVF